MCSRSVLSGAWLVLAELLATADGAPRSLMTSVLGFPRISQDFLGLPSMEIRLDFLA